MQLEEEQVTAEFILEKFAAMELKLLKAFNGVRRKNPQESRQRCYESADVEEKEGG